MPFCTKCGAVHGDADQVCANCGAALRSAGGPPGGPPAGYGTPPPGPRGLDFTAGFDQPAAAPYGMPGATYECPNCRNPWYGTQTCQFCGQVWGMPVGIRVSSAGRRLGEYALESVLAFVTLGVGWLIWAAVVFANGQTPAKQLLKMRVVRLETRSTARWGWMFLREILAKGAVGVVAGVTVVGIVLYFWLLWDKDNQELWDKIVGTVVVDDPANVLLRPWAYS